MMRLPFTRLINPRIRILARPPQIPDMTEQMSLRILHPQVAELRANRQKSNRRLPPGPTLHRQPLDQHKPTPVQHLVEYSLQSRCSNLELRRELDPSIAVRPRSCRHTTPSDREPRVASPFCGNITNARIQVDVLQVDRESQAFPLALRKVEVAHECTPNPSLPVCRTITRSTSTQSCPRPAIAFSTIKSSTEQVRKEMPGG